MWQGVDEVWQHSTPWWKPGLVEYTVVGVNEATLWKVQAAQAAPLPEGGSALQACMFLILGVLCCWSPSVRALPQAKICKVLCASFECVCVFCILISPQSWLTSICLGHQWAEADHPKGAGKAQHLCACKGLTWLLCSEFTCSKRWQQSQIS